LAEKSTACPLYIIKPQASCTLARDEMQGRLAALDDIHRASRGDDMPSLWLAPAAWINKKRYRECDTSFCWLITLIMIQMPLFLRKGGQYAM
jgi:hypothetical protein